MPPIFREAIWFVQVHSDISEKLAKTYPSVKQYMALFNKHGFRCVSALNLLSTGAPHFNDIYLNPEGPLNEDWRTATSMFQIAGPEKEKEIMNRVLDMKEKDNLTQFMNAHDRTSDIGMMTLFVCISI